ncbi:UNVERIFIED_CONTAM: hypothetical protein K2H54_000832 [Gekko kuhli]
MVHHLLDDLEMPNPLLGGLLPTGSQLVARGSPAPSPNIHCNPSPFSLEREEGEGWLRASQSDALLAELELTSESLNEVDTTPPKVCFLLERDNKDKLASTVSRTPVEQNKKLMTPGTKKVQPALNSQRHGEDAGNVYSKVPAPQPLVPSSSSTSAAEQLDDLLACLGAGQSKASYGTEGPAEPSPGERNTTDTLDSMLEGLTQGLQDLGVAAVPKGNCASCHKPIAGKVVTALGQTWHPEHFTCAHCRKVMGARPFFERDSKAYCQEDYHQLFSPHCAYCSAPIQEKVLTAMDQTWHPEHFFCAHCGKTFGNDGLLFSPFSPPKSLTLPLVFA